jgi:hypothetical protein
MATVLAFAILSGIAGAATAHLRPMKTQTRFLATSTCIRGTWGMNQDIYLAEIVPSGGNEPLLVRMIDEYPNLQLPLSVDRLNSTAGSLLRIKRDMQCDVPYTRMQLRTAPGDPMAILPERLGYKPELGRTPGPNEVLRCYRTVRPR